MRLLKRTLALLLALALALAVPAWAEVSERTLSAAVTDTAQYMYKTVKNLNRPRLYGQHKKQPDVGRNEF